LQSERQTPQRPQDTSCHSSVTQKGVQKPQGALLHRSSSQMARRGRAVVLAVLPQYSGPFKILYKKSASVVIRAPGPCVPPKYTERSSTALNGVAPIEINLSKPAATLSSVSSGRTAYTGTPCLRAVSACRMEPPELPVSITITARDSALVMRFLSMYLPRCIFVSEVTSLMSAPDREILPASSRFVPGTMFSISPGSTAMVSPPKFSAAS